MHNKTLAPIHEGFKTSDPNILQSHASDPQASVWVGASAGTGKTKVLTDRVLRLLLPSGPEKTATPPHKILCLTFTKAGAGEMALRISNTLSQWAVMQEDVLSDIISKLTGETATPEIIFAARKLFSEVIDTPGGLKILTIHSFCQSILGRFPLEAGLNPQFKVMEESEASLLLETAQKTILRRATLNQDHTLAASINRISGETTESVFTSLIKNALSERNTLNHIRSRFNDADSLYAFYCRTLGITSDTSKEEFLNSHICDSAFDYHGLKDAAKLLSASKNITDRDRASLILQFLEKSPQDRLRYFEDYTAAFLTAENKIRARLVTADIVKSHPHCADILAAEAQRLDALLETIRKINCARLNTDLLQISYEIWDEYQSLKYQKGRLDYDDLILKTRDLLKATSRNHRSSWVHYKLDEGIDHILIDEAQDTNPEQWQIIDALSEEFYAGSSARDQIRTLFTVGDEKQSIYSFQRASPSEFARMKSHFKDRILQAQQRWNEVPMDISFRSAQSVLKAVDLTFKPPPLQRALSSRPIGHTSFRVGQAGLVELWPLFENDEDHEIDLWSAQTTHHNNQTGVVKMAETIAMHIRQWLDRKEHLPSYNRALEPGDILILVRTRSKIVQHISKALKDQSIPVGGLDRIILNEQLVVQDLLALASFCLQPQDDLSLACVLKSPLIGMEEEELYNACVDRASLSLWENLQQKCDANIIKHIKNLMKAAVDLNPYDFFAHVLHTLIPNSDMTARSAIIGRLGIDAQEAMDEFLNQALDFVHRPTASLHEFIAEQRHKTVEIKREQETELNAVRIMTVHGAKGLQAPVVFLPDTTTNLRSAPSSGAKRLLWPSQTMLDYPLWSPRKEADCNEYTEAFNTHSELAHAEYLRLLYVAMTRAEERLYITGSTGKKTMPEDCWYTYIQEGLQNAAEIKILENDSLQLSNPQTALPDKSGKLKQAQSENIPLPDWINKNYHHDKAALPIVQPSRLADEASLSPLEGSDTHRFLRGNITHKLLQFLPDLPAERRQEAMLNYLDRFASNLHKDTQQNIFDEVMNILNHPDFGALFSEQAQSEVPISGYIEGKGLINGQIDRLLVTDDVITIIDFKTNRPPPRLPSDIPQAYKDQMRIYYDLVSRIYPGRKLQAALLWTDGPFLMPLDL